MNPQYHRASRTRKFSVLLACTLAALGPAVSSTGATQATPAPEVKAVPPAAVVQEVRLSSLLGTNVRNDAGESLGEVKDVIIDTNSGRVHYAVLSMGGVLGVGEKLFAVPLSRLWPDGKGKLILAVDKAQLESAPTFDSGHWPNWNDQSYRAQIDRQYGNAAPALDARFRRASDVLKTKVRDARGADIGDVKEVVIDLPASRVDYVVVVFDRAWNPNDKLVALPIDKLSGGTSAPRVEPNAHAAAPPLSAPPVLAFESPSGATKGTASAVNPPGSVETRPPAIEPTPNAQVRPLAREPLKTTTSYDDDEKLVFNGTREQLIDAPDFDPKRYPH